MIAFLQRHMNGTFLVAWFHRRHLKQAPSAVNRDIQQAYALFEPSKNNLCTQLVLPVRQASI